MVKKKATKKKATKKKATKKKVVKKATKKKATKKKVVKKATKKKATKKKVAKKSTTKKAAKPAAALVNVEKLAKKVKKARTKSDTMSLLAQSSGLAKKDIVAVLEQLGRLVSHDVGKKGPGVFNLPGLIKVVRVNKPATKSRKGINPFTKEPMIFKAKPARNIVRVRALKALKDSVK